MRISGEVFLEIIVKKEIKKVTKFDLVQANLSINHTKFTLRGFHYQKKKFAEPKLFFSCCRIYT